MPDEQGPFEILEIPATGAYGAVVVARHRQRDGQIVALKVLKSDHLNRRGILKRTRDEARLLFRLRHPNIVRVDELIDVGGRPVLVMEWIEGVSVRQLLDELRSLPVPVAIELARQTALALDAAYNTLSDGRRLRIIHRDLKPSNLLLSIAGELKVVDFGIAHGDFDARETDTVSTIMGTQGYMAPERLEGIADTAAIDVYGLGVTLYELLIGRCLMLPRHPGRHDESLAQAVTQIARGQLGRGQPDDAEVSVDTLRGLADLVRRMCLWQHELRPGVSDVQMELSALLLSCSERPDLAGFAREHVAPLHEGRSRPPKTEHPEYPELKFLEQPWTLSKRAQAGPDDVPTTYVEADNTADRKLRRFLEQSDWSSRLKELTWLLATNHTWTEKPFLEVLERGGTPWWQVWAPRSSPQDMAAAINMLRYRRTPEVLERVRPLAQHRDERIARSARALLDDVTDPG